MMQTTAIITPPANATLKPIQLVDRIYRRLTKMKVKIEDIPADDPEILELSAHLNNIGVVETSLFAVIAVENLENRRTSLIELARSLSISSIEAIALLPMLEPLVKKKLLIIQKPRKPNSYQSEIKFVIPSVVMEYLLYNKIPPVREDDMDVFTFFQKLEVIFSEKEMEVSAHDEFIDQINGIVNDYETLDLIKNFITLELNEMDQLILLSLCLLTVNGKTPIDLDSILRDLTDNRNIYLTTKRELLEGKSILIKQKLVKVEEGHFRSESGISLTKFGISKLFGDDAKLLSLKSGPTMNNMISPDDIEKVNLFFNDDITTKVDTLYKIMEADGYDQVKKRMEKHGLHQGVAILLHGDPGTGKTELVRQLAKKSNRSLVILEVADIKSMWYGESESKLKQFFMDYNSLVSSSENCPILLLNECDQLLSTRLAVKRTVDQTANALQNILLQELENIQGLVIATTNRVDNIDTAFMRRFLYKIKFEKPDLETRTRILMDKMKFLLEDKVKILATDFPDLSGGNIENITRKYLMNKVLYNKPIAFSEICSLAAEECNIVRTKIGFK